MIRATTPTHIFTFPEEVEPSNCEKIQITYSQDSNRGCRFSEHIILEKNKSDLIIEGQSVFVNLTQQEMNKFVASVAQVQVRVKTYSGKVLASQILNVKVKKVLNEEIL